MVKAIVGFSGGTKSLACIDWAKEEFGNDIKTVTFDYGQKLKDIKRLIKELGVDGEICKISPIKDLKKAYFKETAYAKLSFSTILNMLFTVLLLSYAASNNIDNIVIGIEKTKEIDHREMVAFSIQLANAFLKDKNITVYTPMATGDITWH